MYIVSVDTVRAMKEKLNEINSQTLDKVGFMENNKPIKVSCKAVEKWELTGLSNVDFITSGAYKEEG